MSVKMRFVALGVASFLVLALWFGVAYHPASAKLGKLRQDVQTSQSQVVQLQSELSRLQALKANAPQLRASAARFTAALPSDPAVSKFIRLVQDAADSAHISFLSVAPSLPAAAPTTAVAPPAASPGATPVPTATPAGSAAPAAPVAPAAPALQTITISITAKGAFFPMKDFIHRLEHLPRALRVTTFSVSGGFSGSGAPAPGGLTVSLNMSIFTAPAPVTAGPSVATTPAPGA